MDTIWTSGELRQTPPRSAFRCVLVADPSMDETSPIVRKLTDKGYKVCLAKTLADVIQIVSNRTIEYAITELRLADDDARSVLQEVQGRFPLCRVIVYSVSCSLDAAVSLTKAGITDMLPKPADPNFLAAIVLGRSLAEHELGTVIGDPYELRASYILDVYSAYNGSASRAARALSMHRRTLQRFVRRAALQSLAAD